MNTRAHVIYDIEADDLLIAGAKRVLVAGQILGWRVGEFETDPGKKIYGIKIRYVDSLLLTKNVQYVEVPKDAQNVRLSMGELPQKYEEALKASA